MSTTDLLLEIGCEELPAKYLNSLQMNLGSIFKTELTKAQITFEQLQAYATPRRLAILVQGIALQQPTQHIEKRGPAKAVAFDDNGNPSKALQGFSKSCGVNLEELETRTTDKGEWLYYSRQEAGKPTVELLPAIIQYCIEKLPMPKRMRWGSGNEAFLRPIRWLCVVLGGDELVFKCYGLDTSRQTYGHRFHQPNKVNIATAASYVATLRENFVMADAEERRALITQRAADLASQVDGIVKLDETLLTEVAGLVEWPVPLLASFDARFLQVPQEALVSAMQDHQKCFPILDGNNKILPYFITVSNLESIDSQSVIQGNERVMRARLADAEFFYQTDRKISLVERSENLAYVIFQASLGTLLDKAKRMATLCHSLALQQQIDVDLAVRAAKLCKADLLTQMVGEFPELQGIMGYYYALQDKEPETLALAIKEHYLPRFAGDTCPSSLLGSIVALADRLDSLVGIFGINKIPTGDKDPFALRRAANGILRICIEGQLSVDLREMLTEAARCYTTDLPNKNVVTDCLNFIFERLKSYASELGYDALVFASVYANIPTVPYDFLQRMIAVKQFAAEPVAEALVAANKRVSNILQKVAIDDEAQVNPALLVEQSEQVLVACLADKQRHVQPLLQQRCYSEALQSLTDLCLPIDNFFDNVMVMVEDEKLRQNRLAILFSLRQLFTTIADIALLSGSKE